MCITDYFDSWDPINKVEIKSKKKNKGIKSSVVETDITGEDYEKCIFDKKKKIIKQNLIQSYKHNLHSIKSIQNRCQSCISLSI